MAINVIIRKKKGDVSMVWRKPVDGVLNENLVKVLREDEEGVHIEFLEDTFVLGQRSRKKTFYTISEVKATNGYTKASTCVYPWRALSEKLKENNVEVVQNALKIAPLHYRDEYAIPYDTDWQDGRFFIIKRDDALKYVDEMRSESDKEKDSLAYFGVNAVNNVIGERETYAKKVKRVTTKTAADIGFHIENNVHLNEDVDRLTLEFLFKDTSQKCSFDFEIKNPLIDLYRFLVVFDGEEFIEEISKEEIVGCNQIKIKTYKSDEIVEVYCFDTKSIVNGN